MIEPWVYRRADRGRRLAGFIDSIAGGGGLIMMPALLFAGVPPLYALGTNKLQSVFGTAVALRNYWRSGLVEWRPNRLTVGAGLRGRGRAARSSSSRSDAEILDLIIPLLLVAAALYILLSPRMTDEDAHHRVTSAGYAPIGAAIGFYDGFFGPGAGHLLHDQPGRAARLRPDQATALTKLVQSDQRRREPGPVRVRRPSAVAARTVHGGRRDGRRLARQPQRAEVRRAADPAHCWWRSRWA